METFLWVEKYRPTTINDCILPDDLKKMRLVITTPKINPLIKQNKKTYKY